MGMTIESAAIAHNGRLTARSAVRMSDLAAEICLDRAQHQPDEIDMLVNAGIYKDVNVAEPALAAIVQENINANCTTRLGHHGTFSFDLCDGGCGVVTAAQILDAFVGRGSARLGMIVAADTDPSPNAAHGFPFAAAGGALLLSHTEGENGFVAFQSRTFPEFAGMFESHLRWDPYAGLTHHGRNVLEVFEAPGFGTACVEAASLVAYELLQSAGILPAQVDLLITSQYPAAFPAHLARALGIPEDRLPEIPRELVGAHTAGPIAALEAAFASGQMSTARNVLLVACGAGLTVSTALYRP
jgi:3-oxoacyl-[acyl-carrier-protein] synthase-3